jgi:hypothetical protein
VNLRGSYTDETGHMLIQAMCLLVVVGYALNLFWFKNIVKVALFPKERKNLEKAEAGKNE